MAKTMIIESILTYYVALVSLVLMCECRGPSTNTGTNTISGFTTHLFHRDSPQSPFYNASTTRSQLLASAAERSLNRSKHIYEKLQAATPHSMMTAGAGDYLMRFSMGTPVISIVAIADTGSEMIWTQCEPCKKCFPQRRANFEPQFSSTYKNISCNSKVCSYVANTMCDVSGNCIYYALYADGSASNGPLATETFYFGSDRGERLSFPNIVFGCGETNTGPFDSGGSGVVGLGGGRESLVRQLGFDKFSYCLMPMDQLDKESMMHFGADGDVNGDGVIQTPMSLRNPPAHYFLTLEAVSVGDQRLKFHNPFLVEGGNIVIDSGSTITLVPRTFYEDWERAVMSRIAMRPVRGVPGWPLCYRSNNEIMIPKIVFHFKAQADVEWNFNNAFVRVYKGIVCFAAGPVQGVAIYGGVAQANFLVGYDLQRRLVSFKPTLCGN